MFSHEFITYWKPVREKLISLNGWDFDSANKAVEASGQIARAFGYKNYEAQGWGDIELTDKMKTTLILLAESPHMLTLLKTMEARSDNDVKLEV